MNTAPPLATDVVRVAEPLQLEFGGILEDFEIAFQDYGPADAPVVVVLGGISAGRHITADRAGVAPGWWPEIVGNGLAVDTGRLRVIGIDYLGGPGCSTNPEQWKSTDPFPVISTRDQARAIGRLLDELGIRRIQAIIGASYGGMVALAFASLFGERVGRIVVISAAHESHPMATALRSLQRQVVRLGIESGRVEDALRIARGIAMTTYRSAEEFALRFTGRHTLMADGRHFPVEGYLDHCGRKFSEWFSPAAFLCLSESIDLHRVDPATVRVPIKLVGVDTDSLVPAWQMRALHGSLAGRSDLLEIRSVYGHDAFLKESTTISRIIRDALSTEDNQ